MTRPREAQLELLLTISEGLSRGSGEMLRVSQTDAMHAPSCGLAIRDAVEELKWMREENERLRAEIERLRADLATQQGCCDGAAAQDAHIRREREEMQSAKADAWDEGYQDHKEMIDGIARKPSNPYR